MLIDSRHGPKAVDEEIMALLGTAAVTFQVVLTKVDKPSRGDYSKVLEQTRKVLQAYPAAYPEIIATSSEKGTGPDILRTTIATME